MSKSKSRKDTTNDASGSGGSLPSQRALSGETLPSGANTAESNAPAAIPDVSGSSAGKRAGSSLQDLERKVTSRRQSQTEQQNEPIEPAADPFLERYPFWRRCRKPAITAFIIYNVVSISFHLCAPGTFRDRVLQTLNPYLWYTGLWQDFCVFVPNPKDYNVSLTANVHFKNGEVKEYKFPNPADDDHLKRMSTERYRKWVHDNVNAPVYKFWWPDTCKWIARKYMKDPANPPVKVDLVRHWQDINPPGSPSTEGTSHILNFYTYEFPKGDLP